MTDRDAKPWPLNWPSYAALQRQLRPGHVLASAAHVGAAATLLSAVTGHRVRKRRSGGGRLGRLLLTCHTLQHRGRPLEGECGFFVFARHNGDNKASRSVVHESHLEHTCSQRGPPRLSHSTRTAAYTFGMEVTVHAIAVCWCCVGRARALLCVQLLCSCCWCAGVALVLVLLPSRPAPQGGG